MKPEATALNESATETQEDEITASIASYYPNVSTVLSQFGPLTQRDAYFFYLGCLTGSERTQATLQSMREALSQLLLL